MPLYEFQPSLTVDTSDLTVTSTGSGVHLNKAVSVNLDILDRTSGSVLDNRDLLKNAYVDHIDVDILNLDGTVQYQNFLTNYKSNTFTLTEYDNINVFGQYTKDFAIKTTVSESSQTQTSEFYLYGNVPEFSGITVRDSTGTTSHSSSQSSKTAVNASGQTGILTSTVTFNNDSNYISYDRLEIYSSTGSAAFSSQINPNAVFVSALSNESIQSFDINEGILPNDTGVYLHFVPYSNLGTGEAWTVGPYTFKDNPIPTNRFITTEDITGLGDGTLSGVLANGNSAELGFTVGASAINGDLTLGGDIVTTGTTSIGLGGQRLQLKGDFIDFQFAANSAETPQNFLSIDSSEKVNFFKLGNFTSGISVSAGQDISLGGAVIQADSDPNKSTIKYASDNIAFSVGATIDASSSEFDQSNEINSFASAILLGTKNKIFGDFSTILAGSENIISGEESTSSTSVNSDFDFIGAGSGNQITGSRFSSVVGGIGNKIFKTSNHSFIGGGTGNVLEGSPNSVIGGGVNNYINSAESVQIFGSYITGTSVYDGYIYLADNQNRSKQPNASDTLFIDFEGGVDIKTGDLTVEGNITMSGSNVLTAVRTVTAGGNTLGAGETLAFTAGSNMKITESAGAVTIAVDGSAELPTATINNLAASKITSGTFANARISESSVTQHQAALTLVSGQITGALGYTPLSTETDDQTLDEVLAQGNTSSRNITAGAITGSALTIDTDTLFVDSSNNRVGIGTTSPSSILHIDDDASTGTGLKVTGGGSGGPLATFTRDVGSTGTISINSAAGDPQISLASSSNTFALGTNGSNFEICDNDAVGTNTRLIIASDGDVGIGTTSPSAKLDVISNHSQLRLEDSDDSKFVLFSYSGGKLVIRNNSTSTTTNQFTLTEDGKFGIGTTSPAYPFALENSGTGLIARIYNTNADGDGVLIRAGSTSSATRALQVASTNDTKILTVNSNGRVGIGTTSPSHKLTVNGAGTTASFISSNSKSVIKLSDDGADVNLISNSGTFHIGSTSTDLAKFMVNLSSGRVGIGTSSPASLLHLASTGPTILTIEADTDNATETDNARIVLKQDGAIVVGRMGYENNTNALEFINEFNDGLSLGTNNTKRLTITAAGAVGIGTSSPDYLLDIGGDTGSANNTIRMVQADGGTAIRIGAGGNGSNDVNLLRVDGNSSANKGESDSSNFGFSLRYKGSGSGANNSLAFFADNTTAGSQIEALTILNDGKVGIGSTAPGCNLQVAGGTTIPVTTAPNGSISICSVSSTTTPTILGRQTASRTGMYLMAATANGNTSGDMIFNVRENNNSTFATTSNSAFRFQHFSTNLLSILRSGNVGIGTTSPSEKLHVVGKVLADNLFTPQWVTPLMLGACNTNTSGSGSVTSEGKGVGLAAGAGATDSAAIRLDRYFAAARGSGQTTRLDFWNTIVGIGFQRTLVDDTEFFIEIGVAGSPVGPPSDSDKGIFFCLKRVSGAYTYDIRHNRGTAETNTTAVDQSTSFNLSFKFSVEIRTLKTGTLQLYISNDGDEPTLVQEFTGLTFGQNGTTSQHEVWAGYRSIGRTSGNHFVGANSGYVGYWKN